MRNEPNKTIGTDKFESMIGEHMPAIKRLCIGYEFNQNKAEELYQEILVRIWQSLSNFQHNCSFKTWIFRVAHNVAITHVTKERKVNETPVQTLDELVNTLELAGPEKLLETRQTISRLREILSKLKPTDRELMLLYLEGHKQDDIAEIAGLSVGNVATKISRIKSVCRLALESGDKS